MSRRLEEGMTPRRRYLRVTSCEYFERKKNELWRAAIDDATLPFRPVVTTPGGNTMASKKKAARKRAPKSKLILEQIAANTRVAEANAKALELENAEKERRARVAAESAAQQGTIADRLEKSAAAHNPAPDNTAARRSAEIQANAMFIAAHFLESLGFSDAEISVVMNCGTGEVRDRIVTGGQIAKLNGIAVQSHAERFRAMRENQWATGARVAARAMRERIELVLPAAIRASQNYDDVKIERVLDVVRNVLPEDVVEVSAAAKRYAAENEKRNDAPRADSGLFREAQGGALSPRGWNDRDNKREDRVPHPDEGDQSGRCGEHGEFGVGHRFGR